MDTVVEQYLATWNAPAAERPALLESHWASDATYTDPLGEAVGRESIGAFIESARQQFPGLVFTLLGTPDAHHHQVRFRWGLGPADAAPVAEGFDVVVVDDAGRIADVRGFLDRVPA